MQLCFVIVICYHYLFYGSHLALFVIYFQTLQILGCWNFFFPYIVPYAKHCKHFPIHLDTFFCEILALSTFHTVGWTMPLNAAWIRPVTWMNSSLHLMHDFCCHFLRSAIQSISFSFSCFNLQLRLFLTMLIWVSYEVLDAVIFLI